MVRRWAPSWRVEPGTAIFDLPQRRVSPYDHERRSERNHRAEDLMRKAIDHLEQELTKVRAGRANPNMLEGIRVDYYCLRCR